MRPDRDDAIAANRNGLRFGHGGVDGHDLAVTQNQSSRGGLLGRDNSGQEHDREEMFHDDRMILRRF